MNTTQENVIVTGGAGFIGSHVARWLLKKDKFNVIILDDLSGGFVENVPEGATFVQGSVLNNSLIKELFKEYKFKYVFHLAAYAAEGLSHFIKRFNYNNNLIGSINLINASVNYNVKCFVFTSSIAVYGKKQLPIKEDYIPEPEDSYGIAKLAVEQELRASKKMFNLDYIIFRPHNVYGENQNIGDKYRNVIGIFMNQIMQNKPLTIFGDGNQTRAFTYIDDVAPFIAKSIIIKKVYNQVFNIGNDKYYTINQLAEIVCKAMDVKPDIRYSKERKEVINLYAEHKKFYEYFKINPKNLVSLKEGIDRMAKWALKQGCRKSKEFKDIEILKNLPKIWLEND